MLYRALADAVMLVHFGFLAFLVFGGFVAWRFRWVSVPHAAAVVGHGGSGTTRTTSRE